ncbi:hypothetical protein CALCODRAFT_132079 [Calocera cornea HHB12733]|uniref:Cytochrome P450 n=1 Tax=Calocera cornea HHB12733 TaxID=1353952 RepID=A0A165CWI0_9BASI|nr:hypothetical protein CALCODRAFT_132079 [Calocera cornea HHB12733]
MEVYIVIVLTIVLWVVLRATTSPRSEVPLVGSWMLFGYVTATKAMFVSKRYLEQGYQKYKDRTFQIPGFQDSTFYVSSTKLITEIRKAPDSVLSFWAELDVAQAARYTLSPSTADDPSHIALLHKALSSSRVDKLLPEIFDEMEYAFDKVLALPETGAKTVKFYNTFLEIIVRINNRMLVGLPLCRDDGYTKFTCKFMEPISITAFLLSLWPDFLKP